MHLHATTPYSLNIACIIYCTRRKISLPHCRKSQTNLTGVVPHKLMIMHNNYAHARCQKSSCWWVPLSLPLRTSPFEDLATGLCLVLSTAKIKSILIFLRNKARFLIILSHMVIPFLSSAQCKDGEVRLIGEGLTGRVEVCISQRWGGVYRYGWSSSTAASVVCKELGYSDIGMYNYNYYHPYNFLISILL